MNTIYVLYGGSSVDGRGYADYHGFTEDIREAVDFARKENSPYSIGYVERLSNYPYKEKRRLMFSQLLKEPLEL